MHLFRRVLIAIILAFSVLLIDADGYGAITPSFGYEEGQANSLGPAFGPEPSHPATTTEEDSLGVAEPPQANSDTPGVAPWHPSPLSGPIENPRIMNFGVVEQGIVYRSAQPTEANYDWLLSNGFKSVVSFRREKGDDRDHVLGLGFRNYLWLNIEDERDPTDEHAERFLDFVTDSQNWPILIHCKVGLGRTGTMAALIRYAIDGWSMEEALEEARLYRNGFDLAPSQLEWLTRWAANHPPASHRPITENQGIPQS